MPVQTRFPHNFSLVADPSEPPQFEHDCDSCLFLGRHAHECRAADLYVHCGPGETTVIARYASEGSCYCSGLPFSYGMNPALTEARLRAQKLGLLQYDPLEALTYAKKGSTCEAELQEVLLGRPEYKAVLAFDAGDRDYSVELLLECAAPWDNFEATRIVGLQVRVSRILTTLRGALNRKDYQTVHDMFEPLWQMSIDAKAEALRA